MTVKPQTWASPATMRDIEMFRNSALILVPRLPQHWTASLESMAQEKPRPEVRDRNVPVLFRWNELSPRQKKTPVPFPPTAAIWSSPMVRPVTAAPLYTRFTGGVAEVFPVLGQQRMLRPPARRPQRKLRPPETEEKETLGKRGKDDEASNSTDTREQRMEFGEAPERTPQTVPELIASVAAEPSASAPEKTKMRTAATVTAAVSEILIGRSDAPLSLALHRRSTIRLKQ